MIKQKIKYDNAAILQQSLIYTDEYRILMEYIDNSIDAAEKYFDAATNQYSKDIVIEIKLEGSATTKNNNK
ncbi:MAG: hypothetical protein J0M18_21245 [Ignavibacteria bacterium]|nr:hypothetical protein [Ignavibacteria bacterium]